MKSHHISFRIDDLCHILMIVDVSTYVNISASLGGEMDYCCTPLFEGVLDEAQAVETASMLAALADPMRLRIVSMLAAAPDGVACGCDLEVPLGLSQPTVSHHLKVLREAGLVANERRGRWVHYWVVPERLEEIRLALSPGVREFVCSRPRALRIAGFAAQSGAARGATGHRGPTKILRSERLRQVRRAPVPRR